MTALYEGLCLVVLGGTVPLAGWLGWALWRRCRPALRPRREPDPGPDLPEHASKLSLEARLRQGERP